MMDFRATHYIEILPARMTIAPSGMRTPGEGRRRVLVVEDDPDTLDLLKELMEESGYWVVQAKDGAEALSHLEQGAGKPQLILLDWQMPGMGGEALLAQLKARAELAEIPVLVLTGHKLAGMDGVEYLRKPMSVNVLLERVERLATSRPQS